MPSAMLETDLVEQDQLPLMCALRACLKCLSAFLSAEVPFSLPVPPPFTKSAPACLEVPTSGDDKNISSSVMYPDNSEKEDDDDDDDLSDNFK